MPEPTKLNHSVHNHFINIAVHQKSNQGHNSTEEKIAYINANINNYQ
jgi:hypothetical protein